MASLLAALLESWERNNRIMVNLLRAVPDGALQNRDRLARMLMTPAR
jgi:hypothetical protein